MTIVSPATTGVRLIVSSLSEQTRTTSIQALGGRTELYAVALISHAFASEVVSFRVRSATRPLRCADKDVVMPG
jgi:hypothetical protein